MSINKQWYVKEYANDIHSHLREKEQLRFLYHGNSHHLTTRNSIVIWMMEIADRLKFCPAAKHLAVYLFDMFMDNHEVGKYIKLLALSCLTVAVKVEEDTQTPTNSTFRAILQNEYRLSEFVNMEMNILRFYNWEVLIPTAVHFIEYYSLFILSSTDTVQGEHIRNSEKYKLCVQRYMEYFQNMILQDVIFYKFSPSVVASACILATRSCLGISPPWSLVLQNITCYKYTHLKPCMDIMIRKLNTEAAVNIVAQVRGCSSIIVDNSYLVLQTQ